MQSRKHTTLLGVVVETLAGREDAARALLAHLVDDLLDPIDHAEDLQIYIFASALSKRLESDKQEQLNLYLRRFQQPQIALFNLLARRLPTVSLAVPMANTLLARFMGGHDEVTLLDIGIGSGRQEVALVHRLAGEGRLPKRLNVLAIEPDTGSLQEAHRGLREASVELGFELRFFPVPKLIEDLDAADWESFACFGSPLVVNAAFAAHHVRCTDENPMRDTLFRRLRELDPVALVLSEPSSDHHTASLAERFHNAWHHFGLTFRLIDELDVGVEESAAMKMFFAREIEDILASDEENRCERHEPVGAWLERLRRAGFTPYGDFGFASELRHERVRVAPGEGHVALEYDDQPLVAVICATSGVAAMASRSSEAVLQQAA